MLSQTSEHALRAVLYLARNPSRAVAAESIASALGAPPNYLSKTLHALARAGVVGGTRGPNGGFRLLVAPQDLTVARVIEIFDGPVSHQACMSGGRMCDPNNPCHAHVRWSQVLAAVREPFLSTTVAELAAGELAIPDAV